MSFGPQGPFGLSSPEGAIVSVQTNYPVANGVSTVLCDASAGNMTVTIPLAAKNPNRFIKIVKIDSSANGVTVSLTGADTALTNRTLVLYNQYGTIQLGSNGKTGWVLLYSSRFGLLPVTSSDTGTFSTNSASYTNVTNCTVTVIASGLPINLVVGPSNTGTDPEGTLTDTSYISAVGISTQVGFFRWRRGSTTLGQIAIEGPAATGSNSIIVPPGSLNFVDTSAVGGTTYTYQLQCLGASPSPSVAVNRCVLTAYEILS